MSTISTSSPAANFPIGLDRSQLAARLGAHVRILARAIMRNGIMMTVADDGEAAGVHGQSPRLSPDGSRFLAPPARVFLIIVNKPRLLLAYITGCYAPSFLLRALLLLLLFFSLSLSRFSNAPCSWQAQIRSASLYDVCTNN